MATNVSLAVASVNSLRRGFLPVHTGLSLVRKGIDERIRELAHRQAEAERALDPDISEHEAPWAAQALPLVDPLHWTKGIKQRVKLPGISFEASGHKPAPAPTAEEIAATSEEVRKTIRDFLDRVWNEWTLPRSRGEKVGKPPLLTLKVPTGVGKTQAVVEILREELAKRPYAWVETSDKADWARTPTLFLTPSYRLASEVEGRLKAENGLPDVSVGYFMGKERMAELGDGCRRMDEVRALTSSGFSAHRLCRQLVKAKDGSVTEHRCPFFDDCAVRAQKDHYSQDPWQRGYWEGTKLVKGEVWEPVADVVLLPHAFGTQKTLPMQIANPRLFVWDESVVGQLLAQAAFPASVLERPVRLPPRLTVAEREANMDPAGLYADYMRLCLDVGAALRQGIDVADAVLWRAEVEVDRWTGEEILRKRQERLDSRFDWRNAGEAVYERAISLLKLAKRVSWAAGQADSDIDGSLTETPDLERVLAIASTPTAPHAREEWRLWQIALERVELLQKRAAGERKIAALAELGAGPDLLDAHWRKLDEEAPLPRDRELRVGYDRANQMVELGWRNEFAWAGKAPGIVLDASADEELCRVLLGADFDLEYKEIAARLRLRTIMVVGQSNATTSLLPPASAKPYYEEVRDAEGRLVDLRLRDPNHEAARKRLRLERGISTIARQFQGGSGVLVTATKKVEAEIRSWPIGGGEAIAAQAAGLADPYRVADAGLRTAHYGALRGLDGYGQFDALIAVGRLELPPDVLRRYGLALAFDQPEREGDVLPPRRPSEAADAFTVVTRRNKMRDGRVACIATRTPRSRWERLFLAQKREEELTQAIGRLRPFHKADRGDAPEGWQVAFIMGSVVPEGVVIDDILHIEDLARRSKLLEVAASNGGCISSRAWAATDFVRSAGGAAEALRAASEQLRCMGLSEAYELPAGWACVACKRPGRGAPYVVYTDLSMTTNDPVEAALEHLRGFGLDVVAGRIIRQSPLPDAAVLAEADTRASSREERLEAYGQAAAEVAAELPGLSGEELAVATELRRYERHSVAEGVVLRPVGGAEGDPAPSADQAPPVKRAA